MPRPPQEGLGERIKRLRSARGIAQRELARRAGVSPAYLSRIENHGRQPSAQIVRKFARALAVAADYLETGADVTAREELELALADAELNARLTPEAKDLEHEFAALARLAEREGQTDIAARARADLGAVLAVAGSLKEAVMHLEAAIADPFFSPAVYPDTYTTLAEVYRKVGDPSAAVALCERTLGELEQDVTPVRTILATYLSHALSDLGDFARAEQVLSELQDDIALADPYARARMHWSLARVATMQDKRRLALRHMHRAIALLKGTEDIEHLARAHVLCAQILLWGDRTAGVRRHLESARALITKSPDVVSRGSLLGLEALLAARQERYLEAAVASSESLAMLRESETYCTPALYAQGLAAASEDQIDAAEASFEECIRILSKSDLWREASAVALDWARALAEAGEPEHSARVSARATELAERASGSAAGVSV